MEIKEILDSIKTQGHWRVLVEPLKYEGEVFSTSECREVINSARVRLRGWDYPHVPMNSREHEGIVNGQGYIEGWIHWEAYREVWRMYRSGQFVHFFGLREDWGRWDHMIPSEAGKVIGVIGSVIYQLTEIFLFISRLVQNDVYTNGVKVEISLLGNEGRQLWLFDPMRAGFLEKYDRATGPIVFNRVLSRKELLQGSDKIAIDCITEIFHRYGWSNFSEDMIIKDQKALLERRI